MDALTDARAQILLKGLAIASQNLARLHRREEKLAAQGLLQTPVTDFLNHPTHGTIALAPSETQALSSEDCPQASSPDPIPVLTPDPSPSTSYDEGKSLKLSAYFQTVDDQRRARSEAFLAQLEQDLEQELEARFDDR